MPGVPQQRDLLELGYRCECVTRRATDNSQYALAQCLDATRTMQAIVWIRVALRTVVGTLDPKEAQRAYGWLDTGQWEALHWLDRGEPVTFAVTAGELRIEWSARPVWFLPLLHRKTGQLPNCSTDFACTDPRPGGGCGVHSPVRAHHHREGRNPP